MSAEVDEHHTFEEEVFSYLASKDGKVFLYWHTKQVKVLKGEEARQFIARIDGLDNQAAQLLMAKATGNFKRGNEKRID